MSAARLFSAFLEQRRASGPAAAGRALEAALAGSVGLPPPLRALLDRVASYSQRAGRGSGVYQDDAGAFEAFIQNGGNVGLYNELAAALAAAWPEPERADWRLLDIGTGSGLGLGPAVGRCSVRPAGVEMVEPSAELLQAAMERLRPLVGRAAVPHGMPVREFMERAGDRRWEVAQATFALQSLPPGERAEVFEWLAGRCDKLLLAEFDVPACVRDGPESERVESVLEAYAKGVAEYTPLGETGMRVLDGFLVPVMLGAFEGGRPTNYEQPVSGWMDELRSAGFSSVQSSPVFPYWWAEAHLIQATHD